MPKDLYSWRAKKTALPRLAALVVLASIPAPASAQGLAHTVLCSGEEYRYRLLRAEGTQPAPAVLLLHGAGGTPEPMIAVWARLATREHVTLIAPELPRVLSFEEKAPAVFECMIEDARHTAAIDMKRIYLFGHSMGGYLTYDAALLRSTFYAAAAVHAMGIEVGYMSMVAKAERKIPVAMYIGDRDPLVSLESVRKTRDVLLQQGFPVRYQEINGHDHDYGAVAEQVNEDAWAFLKNKHLP